MLHTISDPYTDLTKTYYDMLSLKNTNRNTFIDDLSVCVGKQ